PGGQERWRVHLLLFELIKNSTGRAKFLPGTTFEFLALNFGGRGTPISEKLVNEEDAPIDSVAPGHYVKHLSRELSLKRDKTCRLRQDKM
ncbi:MAG: hypothetical protein K6U74_03815, partial [Firmicutes bacterium]|nr:hypothetical protein [Bacillota bacterium]